MACLRPEEAATIANGVWTIGQPTESLTSFAIDSRVLEPGQTFVALATERRDGHDFLDQARERGAAAALVERTRHEVELPQLRVRDTCQSLHSLARSWRQRFDRTVIGITGSFGKTTVRELLGRVLGSQWYRTPGNLNNTLGLPLCLLDLDRRHDAGAILEAGINQPGEMDLLADLMDPDMVLITGVGPAHLEQLGDLDGVAREKARLAHGVRPGGQVILPADLLAYDPFRRIPESVQVHAIGVNAGSRLPAGFDDLPNVSFTNYKWAAKHGSRGTGTLAGDGTGSSGSFHFSAASPGMVSNLALVVHAARLLEVPGTTIQACLEGWKPFAHRGEIYRQGKRLYYADCYNANPASMVDSARRFQNLFAGRSQFYVIGSMDELGEKAAQWHRRTASELAIPRDAEVFCVGPGREWLREGLLEAGHAPERINLGETADPVLPALEAFEGAVFLKGSRSQRLENLIPGGAESC